MAPIQHTPIDYERWDFSGQGKNILDELKVPERILWMKALPFQDKRKDIGHAETATYFANVILKYFPQADRNIVIPAIILHDTGWGKMSEEDHKLFYAPMAEFAKHEPLLRWKHQLHGTVFATEMMASMIPGETYTNKHLVAVAKIISEHDTKKSFDSLEEGVARAGDMLWRFTFMDVYKESLSREGFTLEKHYSQHPKWLADEKFFHPKITDVAREIAKTELENSKQYLKKMGIGQ